LTFVAKLVDTIVNGVIVDKRCVSRNGDEPAARARMGSQQLAVESELAESRGDRVVEDYVRSVGRVNLGAVPSLLQILGEGRRQIHKVDVGVKLGSFCRRAWNALGRDIILL
jgi:hypothetical protein